MIGGAQPYLLIVNGYKAAAPPKRSGNREKKYGVEDFFNAFFY
jgi:hypothetical protein